MLGYSLAQLVEAAKEALEVLEDEGVGEFAQAQLRVAIPPIEKLLGEESKVYVQEQETVVYLYDKTSLKLYNKPGNS